jgi:O-antigen/teichoic acid export membrane protein
MTEPATASLPRGFRAPGTTVMVLGSLVGAVGAFGFQWYGARVFDRETYGPIGALWTSFFILVTVLLVPVEQYVTREVARGRKSLPQHLKVAAGMAGLCAVLGAGFVTVTLDASFAGDPVYILQIVLLSAGYGLLFVGKGILAGARRFQEVGWMLMVESLVRLAAAVGFVALARTPASMGWGMVVGGFSVLALAWWRRDTGDPGVEATPPARFLRGYVGGSAPAQVLLAAAPLAVLALGGDSGLLSVLFVTFTLYRAPITLVFSLQGRLLPYLTGMSTAGEHHGLARIVRRVMTAGVVLTALGGLVGWVVGPEVVSLLYPDEYAPARLVAALVAAGVTAAATAQIASQVLVAEGRTKRLGYAWTTGLAAAVVVAVLASGTPDGRVATGFASGEVVALAMMGVLALRRPA